MILQMESAGKRRDSQKGTGQPKRDGTAQKDGTTMAFTDGVRKEETGLEILNMNMKRKIYVASSWRNEYHPEVVEKLREALK